MTDINIETSFSVTFHVNVGEALQTKCNGHDTTGKKIHKRSHFQRYFWLLRMCRIGIVADTEARAGEHAHLRDGCPLLAACRRPGENNSIFRSVAHAHQVFFCLVLPVNYSTMTVTFTTTNSRSCRKVEPPV